MTSLQQQVATLQQNNNDQPLQYIKSTLFSLNILRAQMPQGIEVPFFEKYGGRGDILSNFSTFIALFSDFTFEDKLLVKLFPRSLKDTTFEFFSYLPNN